MFAPVFWFKAKHIEDMKDDYQGWFPLVFIFFPFKKWWAKFCSYMSQLWSDASSLTSAELLQLCFSVAKRQSKLCVCGGQLEFMLSFNNALSLVLFQFNVCLQCLAWTKWILESIHQIFTLVPYWGWKHKAHFFPLMWNLVCDVLISSFNLICILFYCLFSIPVIARVPGTKAMTDKTYLTRTDMAGCPSPVLTLVGNIWVCSLG